MRRDWRDPTPLRSGSPRQRDAWRVLRELDIFSVLAEFDPVLTSTVNLGVDTPERDLDVACEVEDPGRFREVTAAAFGHHEGFGIRERLDESTAWVFSFRLGGFRAELFGEPRGAVLALSDLDDEALRRAVALP